MFDTVKAWQCIGCGRIEAPQPCIGVCQDRRAEFVYASEHADALAAAERARRRASAFEVLLRQLAHTTPRSGGWERSYRSLQEHARHVLADHPAEPDREP
jgi:hypothetical protein